MVTKFGTEVRPNTLLNSTGNGVSSYFQSAAIRHFVNVDILNFGQFLPSGLIKIKSWFLCYVGALVSGFAEFHQTW